MKKIWATVYPSSIRDGRLPELTTGQEITTDLSIHIDIDSPPIPVSPFMRSTEWIAGHPARWLVDAGAAILLPTALELPPKPDFGWVALRGVVNNSDHGYHDSPGYRTWMVRQIVMQHRPRHNQSDGEIIEEEIFAMHKWTDAKEGYVTRYLLDLAT